MSVQDLIQPAIKGCSKKTISCWNGVIGKENYDNCIKNADIIVTQPINPSYRDLTYLHTEYVLENAKPDAKIVIFPSLRLNFYYFDYYYLKLKSDWLKDPSDYHYLSLANCYKNNLSADHFFTEFVNNETLHSKSFLEDIFNKSILELEEREKKMENYKNIRSCNLIFASSFIKESYKKNLLFYSINHPTKHLLQYIGENILSYLELDSNLLDKDKDPFIKNERGIIYKCIQQVVDFDVSQCKPHLYKHKIEDTRKIIEAYYEVYKKFSAEEFPNRN